MPYQPNRPAESVEILLALKPEIPLVEIPVTEAQGADLVLLALGFDRPWPTCPMDSTTDTLPAISIRNRCNLQAGHEDE
jgi:hypothetical protein